MIGSVFFMNGKWYHVVSRYVDDNGVINLSVGIASLTTGFFRPINEVRRRRPTTTVPENNFIITNVNVLIPAGNEPFTFSVGL